MGAGSTVALAGTAAATGMGATPLRLRPAALAMMTVGGARAVAVVAATIVAAAPPGSVTAEREVAKAGATGVLLGSAGERASSANVGLPR